MPSSTRVRLVRVALVTLHKVVIDAERARFEQSRGRIDNPHAALHLVMQDPFFAWIKPLGQAVVRMDEWLADERLRMTIEPEALVAEVRALLDGRSDAVFAAEYRRALQDSPDVVVAHAQLTAALGPA